MKSHTTPTPFAPQTFLDSAGVSRTAAAYRKAEAIYSQGDACSAVMYIQQGEVRLSALSKTGREATVAVLGPGDFFGEGALAGQPVRGGSATATTPSTILVIEKAEMLRALHEQEAMFDRFIAHLLTRNMDIEEDLIDQLFDRVEKRLARALLLLARYGEPVKPQRIIPKLSHDTLADMVGTTPSRVNFFMNTFRKRGFITYDGGLRINHSLLSVVLHD